MLKTIPSRKLRPGMYLQKLCGSWIKHPFWRSSFLLKDPKDIAAIIDSGVVEVVIDTDKGLDLEEAQEASSHKSAATSSKPAATSSKPTATAAPAKPSANRHTDKRISKRAEWGRAKVICHASKEAVESMFQDVRMGKVVDAEAAGPLVEEISSSVLRSADTLISIARLKTRDNYTYMHSVAVCAMMIALARELGLDEQQVSQAGLAGLLHDLGKAMMPLEVLNKPGKLTDDEFGIMKTHPFEGFQLLQESRGLNSEVLDVVLHHHEKVDGSGYPDKLKGEEISLLSRIGAICDVYDAVTSTRPYKDGWDPALSIKRMASWKGHFDPRLLQAFIKSIGIYPTGSLVKLESGRLGVVLEQSEGTLLEPKVRVFFSTRPKGPIKIELVDLAASNCQDRIVSVEDSVKWGFKKLNELWVPS